MADGNGRVQRMIFQLVLFRCGVQVAWGGTPAGRVPKEDESDRCATHLDDDDGGCWFVLRAVDAGAGVTNGGSVAEEV